MTLGASVPDIGDLPTPWRDPDDATKYWTRDRMHFPGQISMLDEEMIGIIGEHGVNHGAERYGLPFRATTRRFWTRYYTCESVLEMPADEQETLRARSDAAFAAVLDDLDATWTSTWLPEIRGHLAFWSGFDLGAASTTELLDHLADTMRRARRIWRLHFEIVFPLFRARKAFTDLYRELFEPVSKLRALTLLQGVENLTTTAGRRLWRLGEVAEAAPSVQRTLLSVPASDALQVLKGLDDAAPFLDALGAYLEEFGHRGLYLGVGAPTLIEDPTPVLKMLQDALANPDHAIERRFEATVAERDRLIAESRATLRSYPTPVREEFERRLAAAHVASRIDEDHNFLIDFASMAAVRRVFLELGRRCTDAGALARAEDVLHLTSDETAKTLRSVPAVDRRPLVAQRRSEMERWAAIEPPNTLGVPPGPQDQEGNDFQGPPPPPSTEPGVVTGTAGSAGVARGRARVIRSLADVGRLQPGEVLVTPTTSQPWTPLFATAAALVSDTGGVLSHTAVVAREYRLPAVVGTVIGTSMLRDGMLLEVDGDRGVVRIIDEA